MSEWCQHPVIVTFGDDAPSMWSCANCSLRFYPACRKCVTVGHRNGHEDPAWRATLAALRSPEPIPDTPSLREAARAFLDHVREAAEWPTPGIGCDGKCKEATALRAALAERGTE